MFVPDSFDPMCSIPVQQQRRALKGFTRSDFRSRIDLLEVVSGRDGSRGPGSETYSAEAGSTCCFLLDHVFNRMTRDLVVEEVVAKLRKLVKHEDVLSSTLEFPNLVIDLFHVALAAGCSDNLTRDSLEPFEAFPRHFLRQNGYAVTA